jgi:hypothetical protein
MTADNTGYIPFHLAVGSEVLLEIQALKLRIKCVLVGFETGQYIIVRLSAKDLIGSFRSELIKSSPLIVRYLYQGAVYGFKPELLNIVSAPAKIFFLSYPSKIEEYVTRERDRFDCVLPAGTMLDNEIIDMVIIDISAEGCQCVIKEASGKSALYSHMQVNKVLDIRIQFPGKEGTPAPRKGKEPQQGARQNNPRRHVRGARPGRRREDSGVHIPGLFREKMTDATTFRGRFRACERFKPFQIVIN